MAKKTFVIENYEHHLNLKVFKLENDITLLVVGYISLPMYEV